MEDLDAVMEPSDRVTKILELVGVLSQEKFWEINLLLDEFGLEHRSSWSGPMDEYVTEMLRASRDEAIVALHDHHFQSEDDAEPTAVDHLWDGWRFRLFLSHISAEKVFCSGLKEALARNGIDAFVAHEDIEPTQEWILEIERALRSCDALAAILHDGFRESKWADQEVGFCHGRRILIIPVRLELDPYGFIQRYQAVNGRGKEAWEIASMIRTALAAHERTSARMAEALMTLFERSGSFAAAKHNIDFLREVSEWTPSLLRRLESAPGNNGQIARAYGVPEKIDRILNQAMT